MFHSWIIEQVTTEFCIAAKMSLISVRVQCSVEKLRKHTWGRDHFKNLGIDRRVILNGFSRERVSRCELNSFVLVQGPLATYEKYFQNTFDATYLCAVNEKYVQSVQNFR